MPVPAFLLAIPYIGGLATIASFAGKSAATKAAKRAITSKAKTKLRTGGGVKSPGKTAPNLGLVKPKGKTTWLKRSAAAGAGAGLVLTGKDKIQDTIEDALPWLAAAGVVFGFLYLRKKK